MVEELTLLRPNMAAGHKPHIAETARASAAAGAAALVVTHPGTTCPCTGWRSSAATPSCQLSSSPPAPRCATPSSGPNSAVAGRHRGEGDGAAVQPATSQLLR